MTSIEFFLTNWVLNVPALIIAGLLVLFQLITSRFRLTANSYLFYTGVLLFLFMTVSPLQVLGKSYLFSVHMIQHIFFLLIIPPFLVAGTDPEFLKRVFTRPSFATFGKVLLYPLVTWVIGIGSMWFWHIPVVFEAMKHFQFLMIFQVVTLLVFGYIFIWPVFAPTGFMKLNPLESALYLFSACVGCTVLGILITFAPAGIYTAGFTGGNQEIAGLISQGWGITRSVDQEVAGLIMWVPACIVYVTNIMISLGRWYMKSAGTEIEKS